MGPLSRVQPSSPSYRGVIILYKNLTKHSHCGRQSVLIREFYIFVIIYEYRFYFHVNVSGTYAPRFGAHTILDEGTKHEICKAL